jgi:hypothetical protein
MTAASPGLALATVAPDNLTPPTETPAVDAGATQQRCVQDRHPGVLRFELDDSHRWVICQGGGGGMIMPKTIYRTIDGETWTLVAKREWGIQTPVSGVGLAPSGVATLLYFQDELDGWMGTKSAGEAIHRTRDGGITWTAVADLPSDSTVVSVSFSSPRNGTVVTAHGTVDSSTWVSNDGGEHWTKAP